jgi:hypothetical protein
MEGEEIEPDDHFEIEPGFMTVNSQGEAIVHRIIAQGQEEET